jgi:tetratricopeptide (TPR) repeat protein
MMNVGALCAVALLWLATPAWADATLRGVVVRDREHGAPMPRVEVTAPGANPVTTGDDGQFVLTFPQGHPGQDISVRVSRAGWEVVNDVLLDRPLPEPGSTHLFEVILCASGEREQRRMEFYRLKGNQAVDQTYRTKLAELEGRHAATVQERDRLLRERDDARKQMDEWARQAAQRKPDEVGGTYKAAFRLFVDGKIDAALQLLSDERLQQEVNQAQAQLQQAAAGWLLKGQLLTTKFDDDGAGRAYDKAVTAVPGSEAAWEAYALFQQRQHHFARARQGYEKMLTLARQASDCARVAWTLNSLGVLNRAENRKAEARKDFEEALVIRRALASQTPDVYEPGVAQTLDNLGVLNRDEHRKAEARKSFEEALAIRRALASQTPDVYRPYVAQTLDNLGVLNHDENRNAEARKNFEEALAIRRALASQTPDVYRPYIAQTLDNLGVLNRDENRKAEARKNFEEALAIRCALASQNPDVYRPYVAHTLNHLGLLSRAENRKAEARKNFGEALAIYREFAARAPATYQPRVRQVERNLRDLGPVSP